jgi:hypothetical protein
MKHVTATPSSMPFIISALRARFGVYTGFLLKPQLLTPTKSIPVGEDLITRLLYSLS